MKNLFLTSSFADVADLFKKSENNLLQGKIVTFIPTASLHEEVTFYVDAGKEALEKLGLVIDILEISTATHEEISRKLKNNDYIYITGGNSFFLLQELKRTQADKLIIEQVMLGKTYIGESAGSIILSPNIDYVKDMDDFKVTQNLESYEALGLIGFYPLPHYKNFPFDDVTENIVSKFAGKIELRPFSNSQAIWVKEDSIEILA